MQVKDFSPIKANVSEIYPNSYDFDGAEYFFSDSNKQLYCLITRKTELDTSDKYYLLVYLKLEGYNNGIDYDYRIDLNNFIKIEHRMPRPYVDENNSDVYKFVMPDNSNDFNIMFHTSDFMSETGFTQYITTLSDGVKYIDLSAKTNCDNYVYDYLNLKVADNSFNFPRQVYSSDLYTCSKFMVGFGQELIASGSEVFTGTTTTTTTTASPTTTTTTTVAPTTTTTTTTAAPPINIDLTQINDYEDSINTLIRYWAITDTILSVSTDFQVIHTDVNNISTDICSFTIFSGYTEGGCSVNYNKLSSGYTAYANFYNMTTGFTIGADNLNYYISGLTPTTTTTTTIPVSTTTTTQAVGFNFYAAGDTLNANSAFGATLYEINSVEYTSEIDSINGSFIDFSGAKQYTVTSNGTYYVSVRDKNNTSRISTHSAIVSYFTGTTTTTTSTTTAAPTTTTTTAAPTTTTTTTASPLHFYYTREFDCTGCTDISEPLLTEVIKSTITLTMNNYYVFSSITSKKYKIVGNANQALYDSADIQHDFTADSNINNSNCSLISCS